jgi:hypothetical protein
MSDQKTPTNENEKDKTVIFNSGNDRKKPLEGDQTQVENSVKKDSEFDAGKSAPKNESPKEAAPTPADLKSASKNEKKSVSAGVFAAGAAGAAAAGVAAGAVFSEEIKGVFTASAYDAPESPEEEIQDATNMVEESDSSASVENSSDLISATNDAEVDSIAEGASEMSYQFSDENGVYEVSIVDLDSDGEIDSLSADAQLVDGSSINFTAAGDTLHSFFANDQMELAEPSDYVEFCSSGAFEGFGPESLGAESYHIQGGDTLSEIAAANNTSIGDLMALNPQITDANEIYAGDDILIPVGDSDTNPYAGWTPNESEATEEVYFAEDFDSTATDQGEFSEMDWQSFEDEPTEEYSSALNDTDFASMETPDSYLDYSNDADSFDFI